MAGDPNSSDIITATAFFGVFFGLFSFTALQIAKQTWTILKRTHRIWNAYLWMIWVEGLVNLIFAIMTYLYVRGVIKASFGYYFGTVLIWALQTQLLIQIIANRVGLIMIDRRKSRTLKQVLFGVILLVNISVFCIWIPALMEVSPTYVHLNYIWERTEKSIFLVVDGGLNVYFLYLVRANLISKGLTKYWPLFNFNTFAVCVSVTMDGLLLGLLNLPGAYDYVQFAPVAYTVKLSIELIMADLISKIVRNSNRNGGGGGGWHRDTSSQHTSRGGTRLKNLTLSQGGNGYFPGRKHDNIPDESEEDETHLGASSKQHEGAGIMKTVTVKMNSENVAVDPTDCHSETTILQPPSPPGTDRGD